MFENIMLSLCLALIFVKKIKQTIFISWWCTKFCDPSYPMTWLGMYTSITHCVLRAVIKHGATRIQYLDKDLHFHCCDFSVPKSVTRQILWRWKINYMKIKLKNKRSIRWTVQTDPYIRLSATTVITILEEAPFLLTAAIK